MFASWLGTKKIDLLAVKFDANNADHVAALNQKIDAFGKSAGLLLQDDLRIAVAAMIAALLLWVAGKYGVLLGALIFASLWLMGTIQQRPEHNIHFQNLLHELITIYHQCIADKGYQCTANEVMLELLRVIAPYVETNQLWLVNENNPVNYPEGFKKTLSYIAPHRIPFADVKSEASRPAADVALQFLNLSPTTQAGMFRQAGKMMALFQSVRADVKQSVYGYSGANWAVSIKR